MAKNIRIKIKRKIEDSSPGKIVISLSGWLNIATSPLTSYVTMRNYTGKYRIDFGLTTILSLLKNPPAFIIDIFYQILFIIIINANARPAAAETQKMWYLKHSKWIVYHGI